MPRFLDRRRLLGSSLVAAGAATIGVTLALTGPATNVARAATSGNVFLVLHISDSAGGQPPAGGTVVVTAAVTNSSSQSAVITDASPTVALSFSTGVMGFVSNNAGWSCSTTSGSAAETCADGLLSPNASTSLLVTFTVSPAAPMGDPASVTGTVSDVNHINNATFTPSNVTVTDNATVAGPASYTKDVPATAYPAKVAETTVGFSGTQSFTFSDAANTIVVVFNQGVIHGGAHLTVYRANSSFWSSSLSSSSKNLVDGYAVAWTNSSENTTSDAGGNVTLIVSNTSINASDTLFRATKSGVGTQTGTVAAGAWTVTFMQDPGFVLAQAAAAAPTNPPTSAPPAATTTITAPPSGGAPAQTGGTTTLPISAGVLLIIVGTVVLGSGARRREDG